MNLENSIKDVISKKLEDGTIEKLIAEQLEKGVVNALDNLFRSYGDVTKTIEEKVKSVMIPYLEGYDYSEYLVKLDSVLVDVLNNSALENKKILENFKELMIPDEIKTISSRKLFKKWMEYVSKNVDTSDLEVIYDDGVSYESVEVTMDIEYDSDRSWSSFQYATLTFECEKDEKLNFAIRLSRWNGSKDEAWNIRYDAAADISSLRHLNEFEIFLMKLNQAHTTLEIDSSYESDEVTPDKEPEPTYE